MTRDFVGAVESDHQRSARVAAIGRPTMQGRRDLAKRFVVSAYLAAVAGGQAAVPAGRAGNGDSGNDRHGVAAAELAASHSGVLFAAGVLSGQIPLTELASGFSVDDYLPDLSPRQDARPVDPTEPQRAGGGDTHAQRVQKIRKEVEMLPVYQRE